MIISTLDARVESTCLYKKDHVRFVFGGKSTCQSIMKKSNKSIASRDVLFAFESDSESVDENEVSDNQKAMTPPLLPRAKSPSRSKDSGLINSTPRSSCSKKILDSDLSIGSETENELLNRDEKPTLLSKRRKLLPLSKQKTRAFTSSSVSGQLTGSTPTSDASRHKARKSLNQSMEKSPTLVPACKNKYSLPLTAESHADVLSALGKISGMLQTLGQRMENTEKEVKSIKFQLSTPSTVESSKKESVPLYVKVSDPFCMVVPLACIVCITWGHRYSDFYLNQMLCP